MDDADLIQQLRDVIADARDAGMPDRQIRRVLQAVLDGEAG